MDFSKFSDADFDAKEWVNAALRAHKDARVPIDAHASTLVMKLQLFIQEVNKSLEETSLQVVQNLPRVMRDVEAVRQEATLLKEQMHTVKEDIKKVERDTAQSMQRLVELDSIKCRMMESQNALQEADNWTTLSADVEEVFASRDIHMIAEKLTGMQQSLNVLHDVPDYEERKKLLESLKNRLEALLSPRLVAAFNSHNLEEAQQYVKMFAGIERYSQLRNYFISCHKAAVVEIWSLLHDPAKPLLDYLPSFYDELLSHWYSECTWCAQVFTDPVDLLAVLFSQALEALDPPLSRSLQAALQSEAGSLTTLTDARQQALRFVKGLEKTISEVAVPSPPPPSLFSLVEVVHAPFCQFLIQYPHLEQQYLTHTLKDLQLSSSAPEDTVSSLSSSIPAILHSATQALERCAHLTEGWGTAGLVRALEAFFSQYLSKLLSMVHGLRRSCGLDEGSAGGQGEDWAYLQVAFTLIQCCGELLLQCEELNTELCSSLLSRSASLTSPADQSNPFGLYDYLLVYHPEEHTAMMELLSAIEKGGTDHPLLVSTDKHIHSLNARAHTFAFDLLFLKLKRKLSNFPKLKIWETGVVSPLESPRALMDDLPSFTLSPLPYITEIGDYLLTLPQQLEPFTSQETPALTTALKHSHLPFPPTEGGVKEGEEGEGEEHPSDAWLGAIARGTMSTYMTNILQIPSLSQQAASQLATDISYLCNVLAALGQNPLPQLTQLERLVKATMEEFSDFEKDETMSKQLYQALAGIRKWE